MIDDIGAVRAVQNAADGGAAAAPPAPVSRWSVPTKQFSSCPSGFGVDSSTQATQLALNASQFLAQVPPAQGVQQPLAMATQALQAAVHLVAHRAQGATESLAAAGSAQEVPAKAPAKCKRQPKRKAADLDEDPADSADLAANLKKVRRKQVSIQLLPSLFHADHTDPADVLPSGPPDLPS